MNWSSLLVSASILVDLSLPDPKHLCPTLGACATCGRPLVLHYNGLRVLDFDLVAALYAISLWHNLFPPPL